MTSGSMSTATAVAPLAGRDAGLWYPDSVDIDYYHDWKAALARKP